jgi:hypothetical protein
MFTVGPCSAAKQAAESMDIFESPFCRKLTHNTVEETF